MIENKCLTVSQIAEKVNGDFINRNDTNVQNLIMTPHIQQLGLELSGVFLTKKIDCIACWGKKESRFLNNLTSEEQETRLVDLLKLNPPLFLLSKNFKHGDLLVNIINKYQFNTAVIQCCNTTFELINMLGSWMSLQMAKWTTIHGTILNVFGEGILLIGSSGIGKSEAAMELIQKNHMFIADDAIEIALINNIIIARPNKIVEGFIEIRGLGILNIKQMFGIQKILTESNIDVIIELKSNEELEKENIAINRLGRDLQYKTLLGVKVPHYVLPISFARKMSDMIEAAVIDLKLKQAGYNSSERFSERIINILKKG